MFVNWSFKDILYNIYYNMYICYNWIYIKQKLTKFCLLIFGIYIERFRQFANFDGQYFDMKNNNLLDIMKRSENLDNREYFSYAGIIFL